jgi:RHS repeat-associated protein
VETHRYLAFGQESEPASALFPWTFCSKRLDPETGFIFFGRRYYDPTMGRWTTPDPLEDADGPNVYAYLHNNPLLYRDRYGLFTEEWDLFKERSYDLFSGTAHGMGDYLWSNAQALHSCAFHIGCADMDFDVQELTHIRQSFQQTQEDHTAYFESCLQQALPANTASPLYQQTRYCSQAGLELASLATGVYGVAKGCMSLVKVARYSEKAVVSALKSVAKENVKFDLNALSKAGQVMDRSGLTKAGRALDKHGNRLNSPFPKTTGNPASKNMQGQFYLDEILTHHNRKTIISDKGDIRFYTPNGRGAHFRSNGSFKGFLDYE